MPPQPVQSPTGSIRWSARSVQSGTITTYAGGGGWRPGRTAVRLPAQALGPAGVAVDYSDNLYIADLLRVRVVNAGGTINTAVGSGAVPFGGERRTSQSRPVHRELGNRLRWHR